MKYRCGTASAVFGIIGLATIVTGIAVPAPYWTSTCLVIAGSVFVAASVWKATPRENRAEWFRTGMAVLLGALLGFILSSLLTNREEARARSTLKESLEAAVVDELGETRNRLSKAATWDITLLGAADPVSLKNLTYISSEGLRRAVMSGQFGGESGGEMLKLANNIEMYNIIVAFALDVASTALREPGLAELLNTARENLDKGRDMVLQQCTDLLERLREH